VKKVIPVMLAAVFLAACGASSSISGSTVKGITTAAGPGAIEVADATKRSADATEVSHPTAPISHPPERLPVTPASRPAAPPVADPDRATPGMNCQGLGGPGKIKLMCAPL
jgi:hypothetical protein